MRDLLPALKWLFHTPGKYGINPMLNEYDCGNVNVLVLSLYDHDYIGTHALIQAWDHSDPKPEWRFILWQSYCVTNDWPEEYERGWQVGLPKEWDRVPSLEEVGKIVDEYIKTPEHTRFLFV